MGQTNTFDLIIIGGGAAGLTAAISYARSCRGRVAVLEGNAQPGKKLSVTGNGACNLTNTAAAGYEDTKRFINSLGIMLSSDSAGRVYPLNRQAASVRNALVNEAGRLAVRIFTDLRVQSVDNVSGQGFNVHSATELFSSPALIIATGGKSCPQFGNFGDGYLFARKLGHGIKTILPTLVPMVYDPKIATGFSRLKGVRARVCVKLLNAGSAYAAEEGELQFTEYGLSGICVFNLRRFMRRG
jgi:predicted flavoprotein YhiN